MTYGDLPAEARERLDGYFKAQGVRAADTCPADWALAAVRMGLYSLAGDVLGVTVTHCPSAVPPWPPRPVRREPRGPCVASVAKDPPLPQRVLPKYRQVKVGMTKEQLRSRGLDGRDIRIWTQRGHIQWTGGET